MNTIITVEFQGKIVNRVARFDNNADAIAWAKKPGRPVAVDVLDRLRPHAARQGPRSSARRELQMSVPQTITDIVAKYDPLTGDLKRLPAMTHEEALRQLTIAVDNFSRATRRFSMAGSTDREDARINAQGAEIRLMQAQDDARISLAKPAMGEPEFDRRAA
jgi:hypothetical protein